MKKNVLRVISLVLVAGMLFAFASCKQELHVRFVDKDGNDIDMSGLIGAVGNGTVNVPANNNQTPDATPDVTPSQGTETPSQGTEAPSQGTSTGMPATTAEVVNFYKQGVARLKAGEAAYTKKEWQVIDKVDVGMEIINSTVTKLLGNFATTEDKAGEQVSAKGSNEAKDRIAAWTLTDISNVASATCTPAGSNYKIKIVMKDENTPKKGKSMLGQVTNSLLYWEDIENTLLNDSTVNTVLKEFKDIEVIYKGYTIEAEMTPDGKFISIDHTANVDIKIGYAKLIVGKIENASGHMNNYCKYYSFSY